MNIRPKIALLLTVMLLFWTAPAFAENQTPEPSEVLGEAPEASQTQPPETTQPTEAPSVAPSELPTIEPAPTTEPAATQTPPSQPTTPILQLPALPWVTASPSPTPTQSEGYGTVQIILYAYSREGVPLKGYKAQIGDAVKTLDAQGQAQFEKVTVEQQKIALTAPDGVQSTGTLYLSRGVDTAITDKAMGGKYGLNIARNADTVYLTAEYNPEEAVNLTASESKPQPPEIKTQAPEDTSAKQTETPKQPTENQKEYTQKNVFAKFTDSDGKGIPSINIKVETRDGSVSATTNSAGRAEFKGIPYGYTVWTIENADDFELTFKKGVQTYADAGSLNECTVYASPRTQNLYLTFKAKQDGFVLESASEKNDSTLSVLGLILITAVIVIGVTVTIALVKRASGKPPKDFRQDPDYHTPRRGTGGRNKIGRRGGIDDGGYNDKSRL